MKAFDGLLYPYSVLSFVTGDLLWGLLQTNLELYSVYRKSPQCL